jgi:hypothetical protein
LPLDDAIDLGIVHPRRNRQGGRRAPGHRQRPSPGTPRPGAPR